MLKKLRTSDIFPTPRPKQTLDDLLCDLDATEISTSDLKVLVAEFIKETQDDKSEKGYRARLRLEGLRLLADLMKLEGKEKDLDSSVLQLIRKDNSSNDDDI
jgi:hypothetical protein